MSLKRVSSSCLSSITWAVCSIALVLTPTPANAAEADGPAAALLAGAGLCSRGASPGCCGMMEAVVGDANSPLMRCMCVSKVLTSLERQGITLASTINACQDAGRNVSHAAAALGRLAETCPAGSSDAGGAEGRESLGETISILLQAAGGSEGVPEWAVTNLDQGLQAGPAGAAIQGLMRSLGYSILVWVPVAGGAVFVLAAAVSLAIMWLPGLWAHFGTLGLEQRLVSSQHALFVVVFGLQIVPYTALVTIYLFERWSADYFTGADDGLVSQPGCIVGALIMSHAFLYCMEGGLRATIKASWLLLLHHTLFFVLLASGLWVGPSMLMVEATVILDLGAVHELPLYFALLLYRLSSSARLVRAWLVVGMFWYGLTRVVQTGLLIWLLATADPRLQPTAPFVIFVIVAAALTGVQAYTFKIYGGMYKRAPRRAAEARAALSRAREVNGCADAAVAIKDVSSAGGINSLPAGAGLA